MLWITKLFESILCKYVQQKTITAKATIAYHNKTKGNKMFNTITTPQEILEIWLLRLFRKPTFFEIIFLEKQNNK